MNVEIDVAGALQRLLGDARGAPVDVFKHAAMRGFEPEQIITPVGRGAEHGAVARLRQRCRGLDQQRGRQSRAVGIEHHSRPVCPRKKLADRVEQAITEIRKPSADQADRTRQRAAKEVFRAGRSEGRIAGDTGLRRSVTRSQQHVVGHVAQKCGVQRSRFIEGERRDEARLGTPGRRGFGHEGDAARRRYGADAH